MPFIASVYTRLPPLLAAAIAFVIVFGAFLVWRGVSRAEADSERRRSSRIPSTEDAAADPVEDSGAAVVAAKRKP